MFKNTIFMGFTTLIKMLSGIFVFVVMARILGPHDFGIVTYAFTLATLFSLIVEYGFVQQVLRDVGEKPHLVSYIVGQVLVSKFVLTLFTVLISTTYFYFFSIEQSAFFAFYALLIATFLGSFCELLNASFRGIGKYKQETNIATVGALVHLIIMLFSILYWSTIEFVCLGFIVSKLIYLIISWKAYIKNVGRVDFSFNKETLIKSLKNGFPYAADAGFTSFFQQIDTILVNHYLGIASVGLYQAATKWLQGYLQFAPVLANVYLPSIASRNHSINIRKKYIYQLILQMLLLGVMGCIFFNYFADLITSYIYGEKFKEINKIWESIGFLLLVRYVTASFGVVLTGLGYQTVRVYAQIGGLITLLISTKMYIDKYSLNGIVFAQITSAVVILMIYAFFYFLSVKKSISLT